MDLRAHLQQHLVATYAVEREIGAGGMATVWLARDLKHDRQVAIKVLNAELGAVLGVERFLAEIRVTANLQHPNLLPLFDSGDAGGLLYYVMPFVAGETLRARLEREKQLPVDEAVRIAVAVGHALDYAHENGVIHRDLKPENILLQHGQPVIADFGIALAIAKAGGSRVTQTGLSLGTPQYMSPEQAAGDRSIDGRSDIYSLGAILYEMLAGEPPHVGNTVQAIIAKVITDKPRALRLARDTVPEQVERAVEKALAKLPADRFSAAGQFVRALEGDATGLAPAGAASGAARDRDASWIRHPASLASLMAAVLAIAGVAYGAFTRAPLGRAPRAVRFELASPAGSSVRDAAGSLAAISPDGRLLVYTGESATGSQLWIRDLDQSFVRPLAGTDDPRSPAFTADGRAIVYWDNTRRQCQRVPVEGGPAVKVLTCLAPTAVAWYAKDSVVFATNNGGAGTLVRGSINGGAPVRFAQDDSMGTWADESDPHFASDGTTLFFISSALPGPAGDRLAFASLDRRIVQRTPVAASYVLGFSEGRVIFATGDGAIMAVGFDLSRHRLVGPPVATGETARVDAFGLKASLSEGGDLTLLSGNGASRLVYVSRGSDPTPLLAQVRSYGYPRFSPDGSRLAINIEAAGRTDVWIYTLASRSLERLTTSAIFNDRPEWTPDGRRVLFRSGNYGRGAIWWQMADGSAPAEQLTPTLDEAVFEGVMSPDGKTLLYRADSPTRARDLYAMPMDGDRTPTPYLVTEFDELSPRFSPDGRWVVYVSSESGRDEVYVRPFPGPGGRTLISSEGGVEPLWARDGKRIVYRAGHAVIAATVSVTNAVAVTRRDTLLAGPFDVRRLHANYDLTPDGSRLVMIEPSNQDVRPTVIINWGPALAARLGPVK